MSQTPRNARSTAVRRVLLVALASLAILAVVAGVAATSMYRSALPQTDGEIDVPGLSAQVQVLRDEQGIPQPVSYTHLDVYKRQVDDEPPEPDDEDEEDLSLDPDDVPDESPDDDDPDVDDDDFSLDPRSLARLSVR